MCRHSRTHLLDRKISSASQAQARRVRLATGHRPDSVKYKTTVSVQLCWHSLQRPKDKVKMKVFSFMLYSTILFSSGITGTRASENFPALALHGETLTNSCSPESKNELRNQLISAVLNKKSQEGAWELIDILLCGKIDEINTQRLKKSTSDSIFYVVDNTGAEKYISTEIADTDFIQRLFANGSAWQASITTEKNSLRLSYTASEACDEGRLFKMKLGKWYLTSIERACDWGEHRDNKGINSNFITQSNRITNRSFLRHYNCLVASPPWQRIDRSNWNKSGHAVLQA